jgi:hypothetical protein
MLRKATGMLGIVVFSGSCQGFNEGLQPASESLTLPITPRLSLPTAPRWGIYAHSAPSPLLTVVAVKDRQVLVQTGPNLAALVADLLRECQSAWPKWARWHSFKPQAMAAAWVVPDAQLYRFEWPCSPHWGPLDMAAECRLEAGARTHIPPAQLALSYAVRQTADGLLSVKVEVCEQSWVDARQAQTQALNLQLQIYTTRSQVTGLAAFLGLAGPVQQALHQRLEMPLQTLLAPSEFVC